ncbi:MAG: iron-sulfur cluster assembly scaffold protein [Novosphingobium sp.]|nr:iron-sulfur cluster assembly scaffold protein [Novosphingobium sp.]
MASAALYTPRILELATSLAEYGWDDALPLQGSARSRSCGSTIELGLGLDDQGRVEQVGLRSQACAIGQASAALFAREAAGKTADELRRSLQDMRQWLADDGPLPDWPGIEAIEPARDYPGRHGAILLAWQAASEALSSGETRG